MALATDVIDAAFSTGRANMGKHEFADLEVG